MTGVPGLRDLIPPSWADALADELAAPYFARLEAFVAAERAAHAVFPPATEVFQALELTPFDQVRVLVVGQDPYHDDGQAHGLAFSVRDGVKPPPSLVNIMKELHADLGIAPARTGHLASWARQGLLLLNTSLTVRAHSPASHKNRGWERLTDAIIRAVSDKSRRIVFVLWGAHAARKLPLIDTARHSVIQSAHPSPLSARTGFFGSRPFSRINAALREAGQPEIDWRL